MLTARDGKLAAEVAGGIVAEGGTAASMACDVADYAAVEGLVAATTQRFGRPDILINNAGVIEPIATIATSDPAAWATNIQINLVGAFNAVRAVLPGMIAAGGGTIVNVSSGAALRPLEGWSAYCSGKAGVAMLTQAIKLEEHRQRHSRIWFPAGHDRHRHAGADPRLRHEHDQPDSSRQPDAGGASGDGDRLSVHAGGGRPGRCRILAAR
jgi:NAD(P)-dependent dehydrogenase (short-subunit alcohol dehydrogenase family)